MRCQTPELSESTVSVVSFIVFQFWTDGMGSCAMWQQLPITNVAAMFVHDALSVLVTLFVNLLVL